MDMGSALHWNAERVDLDSGNEDSEEELKVPKYGDHKVVVSSRSKGPLFSCLM